MKSLKNILKESLRIGMNDSPFDDKYGYKAEQPNESGICLLLDIATLANDIKNKRIELHTKDYIFDGQNLDINYGSKFYKNDYGYYWIKTTDANPWYTFLLFGTEAKQLLEELLKDQNANIDLSSKLENDVNKNLDWPYKVGVSTHEKEKTWRPILKAEVEYMYKKIY